MRSIPTYRVIAAAMLVAAILIGIASCHVEAQSEFMRGEGMPYDAFDRLPKTDLDVAGATIHVGFAPGDMALPKEKIFDWIKACARAVSIYYGRFPVSSLRLLIVPVDGSRVRGGTTWGYRGAAIRLPIGRDAGVDDLKRDWVIVHEMVHTALPDLDDRYAWLSEGLAVYVEPVARVQAGDLTAREIWLAMLRDMPKGLPQAGDAGLDNTDTWGRKYWGARCSACSPMSRSANGPATNSACRTRCAACSPPVAITRRTGRSRGCSRPPTRRSASTC